MTAKDNLIVVIPAYEPPEEFITYAKQVAQNVKALIVVNDGSNQTFEWVFEEIAKSQNVHYITYPKNHGKGYALKRAFEYCAKNFDKGDIVVTADCDGQHRIKDIYSVFTTTAENPEALVLGSRDFNQPNVPARSKFGNTNIRRIFRLFYGIKIYDAQTGLRGFTVEMAERFLQIKGDRFEYEMSMLIFAKKKAIPMIEKAIDTVYPEDPKDHVSHFKTFSDSMRVLGVVLSNLEWYLLSGIISGILDVIIFWLLSTVIVPIQNPALNILVATAVARVGSSIFNFAFNFKYVFNGSSRRAFFRYYLLWACQLGASYGLAYLFGEVIGWNVTVMKVICDLVLSMLSYQIQNLWVFAEKQPKDNKFYGKFARFTRGVLKVVRKGYRFNVVKPKTPVVYVCRHLNMHAQYTTLVGLPFDVHPFCLSVFFDKKDAYKQYKDYTFSVRKGKKPKKFSLKAKISAMVVSKLVNSLKCVPVYRKSAGALTTFKTAMNYLQKGESLIVYVDVDYTADAQTISEIYSGFLALGEMYYRRNGKSLRFVPIYIDDKYRTVNERPYVCVDNFKHSKDVATEYLKQAINGGLDPSPTPWSMP